MELTAIGARCFRMKLLLFSHLSSDSAPTIGPRLKPQRAGRGALVLLPPHLGGSDRSAPADDRGQRQRRGTSLRLGQRRSDC